MRGCNEIGDFGANVLYQNNGEGTFSDITRRAGVQWFEVRPEGVESNRDGLGARVALLRPAQPIAWRRAHSDGSYLSASSPWVHFGLGENATVEGIGVLWPNGRAEIWKDARPGERITLCETAGQPWTF